jgi:threonine dehydrogenase-like Zn-dependent dehydrogenase
LFLSDIFATAWRSLDFSGFEPGNSVAVFGAGPVGLLAAYSAKLRGASTVYIVDHVAKRLDLAKSIGAVPINFKDEDPVEAILTKEPNGVIRSVDCVGYEAIDKFGRMNSAIVTQQMVAATAPFGGMGSIGVYVPGVEGPGSPQRGEIDGNITFPLSSFFGKNLQWRTGSVDPKIIAPQLLELVNSGKASPSFIISSKISIEKAPEYYSRFSKHLDTKVIIQFK